MTKLEEQILARLERIEKQVNQAEINSRFPLSMWTPEAFHEPGTIGGIVVDEGKAREDTCRCIPLGDNSHLCYSGGVVGALSRDQEQLYCTTREVMEVSPEIQIRQRILKDAAIICQSEVQGIPGERRLEPFMQCLTKIAKKSGLEI